MVTELAMYDITFHKIVQCAYTYNTKAHHYRALKQFVHLQKTMS